MRVTERQQIQTALHSINDNTDALSKVQQQVSLNRRILIPSDDPKGTQKALNLRSYLSAVNGTLNNLDNTGGWLSTTESSLKDLSSIVEKARSKASDAANSTLNAEDLQRMADEVSGLYADAVTLANSKYNNQYVFAGQKVLDKPFDADTTALTYTYKGDSGAVKRELEPGTEITVNTTGQPVVSDVLDSLKSLHDALVANDTDAVSTATDALDAASNQVLDQLTKVGSSAQSVDTSQSRLTSLSTDVKEQIAKVEECDKAGAAVEISGLEQANDATLSMLAKYGFKSLFDYLV